MKSACLSFFLLLAASSSTQVLPAKYTFDFNIIDEIPSHQKEIVFRNVFTAVWDSLHTTSRFAEIEFMTNNIYTYKAGIIYRNHQDTVIHEAYQGKWYMESDSSVCLSHYNDLLKKNVTDTLENNFAFMLKWGKYDPVKDLVFYRKFLFAPKLESKALKRSPVVEIPKFSCWGIN